MRAGGDPGWVAGGVGGSADQGTWVITSYAVADAIAVPLTGWLAMRFGTVRWFMISIIGFGLRWDSSEILVPLPPARLTAFIYGLTKFRHAQ